MDDLIEIRDNYAINMSVPQNFEQTEYHEPFWVLRYGAKGLLGPDRLIFKDEDKGNNFASSLTSA